MLGKMAPFLEMGANRIRGYACARIAGWRSAKGFQLTPDHWISKPQNYFMVGLSGGAPTSNDTVLSGSIVSPGCTTFSVSR